MKTRTLFGLLTALALSSIPAGAKITPGEVGCRVELDRTILPAGSSQTAVVKVTLEAPPPPEKTKRPAVNLSIVLDRSGSMAGSKIQKAKEAAIEAARRLGGRDVFSLVTYDSNVETLIPAQSARNIEQIESKIRSIRSGGNTALFGGVSQGAAEIRKNVEGNYVHRIILLSDGLANVGPSTPGDLGRLGAGLIKEDISVTTVGVGDDFNEDLMTQIAQKSDGNHYFVENSVDLPRIFAAELGDVLSVVARKVILEIEFPEGTKPIRIIGRDGRVHGNRVEVSLNQLYGGQEKYALVEVEVPASEEKQKRQIAVAKCSYENALTSKAAVSSASVTASFSGSEVKVDASANVTVQNEVILNKIAISKDKAIALWESGKKQEAVRELDQSGIANAQLGLKYSVDKEVMDEVEKLQEEAQQWGREGLSKRNRKNIKADNYRTYNQQKQ